MSDSVPEPLVIRASSLPAFVDCSLRAAVSALGPLFRGHGHVVRPPSVTVGALVGGAVHAAAEVGLRERMRGDPLTPLSAMTDAGIAELHRRRREEGDGLDLVVDRDTPTLAVAERQVTKMAGRYRLDVVQSARPVAVERRIVAEYRPGVELSGQGDLLEVEEVRRGEYRLRDLKTSRRRVRAAVHMAQQGAYSLLYATEGFRPGEGRIDALARVALGRPQPAVEALSYDVAAAERIAVAVLDDFAGKALAFAGDGDPARFLPNPASPLCSPRFCRAYGTDVCPATRGAFAE